MRSCIFLFLVCQVGARVTFKQSEVLDNGDLKDRYASNATFRCSAGCRVFSPTRSDAIAILDADGKQILNMRELSEDSKGVELKGGEYHLKKTGTINQYGLHDISYESFVFYAVEKGAANYNSEVVYVNESSKLTLDADIVGPVTFLSSTGVVRINYAPSAQDVIMKVYAAGFDSIDSCLPVYTSSSTSTQATFPVNSPIATINMDRRGAGRLLVVTGDNRQTKLSEGTSAVYITPGFVGCPDIVGDSLYTFDKENAFIMDSFLVYHTKARLSVTINAYLSIKDLNSKIDLWVNTHDMSLYGKNRTISKTYEATAFSIYIHWMYDTIYCPNNTDHFVIQIDVAPKLGNLPINSFETPLATEDTTGVIMFRLAMGASVIILLLCIAKKIASNTYTYVS